MTKPKFNIKNTVQWIPKRPDVARVQVHRLTLSITDDDLRGAAIGWWPTAIGVNFCKAPRLEPPLLKVQGFPASEPPLFVRCNFFAYYEAVFPSVTNYKMTLNDRILYDD